MNQNYICRPVRKDKKAKALCLALLIASVLCFYFSTLFPGYKGILQIISFLLLFPFLQITSKYLLTSYQYGLEDGVLLLSSTQGKRTKNLGSLPLNGKCLLLTEKQFENRKDSFSITHRFSYCQNLFSEEKTYLLAPEESGYLLLVFEPDETLISLLENLIKGNGQ